MPDFAHSRKYFHQNFVAKRHFRLPGLPIYNRDLCHRSSRPNMKTPPTNCQVTEETLKLPSQDDCPLPADPRESNQVQPNITSSDQFADKVRPSKPICHHALFILRSALRTKIPGHRAEMTTRSAVLMKTNRTVWQPCRPSSCASGSRSSLGSSLLNQRSAGRLAPAANFTIHQLTSPNYAKLQLLCFGALWALPSVLAAWPLNTSHQISPDTTNYHYKLF
jgi:hypothetical protein